MKARIWSKLCLANISVAAMMAVEGLAQGPAPQAPASSGTPAQAAASVVATKPAATVNGETITLAEVDAVLKQRLPAAPQPTEAQRRQMQLEVVGILIEDHLLRQYLHRNGPRVEDAQVAQWLNQLEAEQRSHGHTIQDFCRERGITEPQLRSEVVNLLQWVGFVNGRLGEAELKRYYDENRDFFEQVSVRASHILLRVPSSALERESARKKLLELRQEVLAGKIDFGEAAKKHSQCPSAALGGDLGYFPRKFAVEESLAKAAFSLKTGEISDVVETEQGLHLIKVTDRKPGQPSSYDKLKEEIREVAAEEMRQNLLDQQRKTSQIEIAIGSEPALQR